MSQSGAHHSSGGNHLGNRQHCEGEPQRPPELSDRFQTAVGGTGLYAERDDAAAVGEEDDFEQHGRRVGLRPAAVVLVAAIEAGQVELVIDQVVQGMFEAAGQQLPFEIDGDQARAGVNVLEAGHGIGYKRDGSMTIDIPFGARQDAGMKIVFLRPR